MTTSTGTSRKTRVAILGGGPAGLTAAMSLSATPELRARYDVTIYQSGWRVGGKCGQGRKGPANRIEINGTHYLFGAYDAVFDVARDVFAELETAGDQRFGTYASQFLPCRTVAVKEFFNGNWYTWVINLPGNGVPPDSPAPDLTLGDTMRSVIGMIIDGCTPERIAALMPETGGTIETPPAAPDAPHWWQRVADFTGRELHAAEHRVGLGLLHLALDLVHGLEREAMQPTVSEALVWLLSHFRSWAWDLLQKPSTTRIDARRLWQLIDLGTSALIGMIQDHVFEPGGFDGIDQYDLREWLMRSGAQESTAWSAPIVTWYNAIAAYEHGDVSQTQHVRRHRIARTDPSRADLPRRVLFPAELRGRRLARRPDVSSAQEPRRARHVLSPRARRCSFGRRRNDRVHRRRAAGHAQERRPVLVRSVHDTPERTPRVARRTARRSDR